MHHDAIAHLRRADPVMARVIRAAGPCTLRPERTRPVFDSMARCIVYQQLSGKAAATIHARVRGAAGGRYLSPGRILELPDEALRGAGLSRQKVRYLKSLAEHAARGDLPSSGMSRLTDDEIIRRLTEVTGVGRWTAQMFLMFRMGRPDVLPATDLGVQKGVKVAYGLRQLPTPARVERLGARWTPWRTVASWYLWRAVELEPGQREELRA
jgi:DNA-3-methyladenine glycosylase II